MPSYEDYMGSICMWGTNWAPQEWALCAGQLMPIQGNEAMFSLLGTTYGGDGVTTFGIPDLQGRVAVGFQLGVNSLGMHGGSLQQLLTLSNTPLPPHGHDASAQVAIHVSNSPGQINTPGGYYLAQSPAGDGYSDSFSATLNGVEMLGIVNAAAAIPPQQPITTLPNFQVVNYIICLYGVYPIRPT